MIRIAIVEDDVKYAEVLEGYISNHAKNSGLELFVTRFSDGLEFISEYQGDFQIVFMDIEMPHMDGLTAAKKLREVDQQVALLFVTNLAKLAIKGYEVDAIDFIVKPVSEYIFSVKLEKALRYVRINRKESFLILQKDDQKFKLLLSDIDYVEKDKNYLVYHTTQGDFRRRGSMQDAENDLMKDDCSTFAKCISGCLINLGKVTRITSSTVIVKDKEIPISRPMHKEFMERMMKFYREGK